MNSTLTEKRIAILATDGFEQSELLEPKRALEAAGAICDVISPKAGQIKGWQESDWGEAVTVDLELAEASAADYDGLVLPGGVMNPDKLRTNDDAMAFVQAFVEAGKPIGAICHGPWSLVEIGAVQGRTLTSWPSLQTDIENAGGHWVDREVCVDQGIVTSRKPDDLPAFNQKLIEELSEGRHRRSQPAIASSQSELEQEMMEKNLPL